MATVQKPQTSRRATIRDLYRVEGRAELVNGRILKMSPVGRQHSRIAKRIMLSLTAYEQVIRNGEAFTDNVAFLARLPNRRSFSPDVSYYNGPPPADPAGFLPEPPIFAVEVRSRSDAGRAGEKRMKASRADYFAAGTKVVWDVDPIKEIVRVYRATKLDEPTVYQIGQVADAEPALAGWRMSVAEIFA